MAADVLAPQRESLTDEGVDFAAGAAGVGVDELFPQPEDDGDDVRDEEPELARLPLPELDELPAPGRAVNGWTSDREQTKTMIFLNMVFRDELAPLFVLVSGRMQSRKAPWGEGRISELILSGGTVVQPVWAPALASKVCSVQERDAHTPNLSSPLVAFGHAPANPEAARMSRVAATRR